MKESFQSFIAIILDTFYLGILNTIGNDLVEVDHTLGIWFNSQVHCQFNSKSFPYSPLIYFPERVISVPQFLQELHVIVAVSEGLKDEYGAMSERLQRCTAF